MTRDGKQPPRRRYRRTSPRRRTRFLKALEGSGNVCEAAAETGFPRATIYKLRRQDAGFATAMDAATAAADARLTAEAEEDARSPRPPAAEDALIIRKGRGGRTQLVAAGTHWWGARADAIFLAHFRRSGNVTLSAKAAGFSAKAAHERRARSAGFARAWKEAAEEAEIWLEWRLVVDAGGMPELAPEAAAALGMAAEEAAAKAFDPYLAMWLLKGRDGRRDGSWSQPHRSMSKEEAYAVILRKIEAIERYDRKFGKSRRRE
jgi:hypothetical protein